MLQPARARVGEGDDAVDPHAPPPNGAVVFQVPPEGEDPARWVMLAGRGTQVRSSHGLEGMIVRVQHLTHVCVDDGEDG